MFESSSAPTHKPVQPDFEAEVRFLTADEGGRQSPPRQGYRPDIQYDDDTAENLWMVWPRFLDECGCELSDGEVIPQTCRAHFYIVNDELRRTIHRQRLRVDVRFHPAAATEDSSRKWR